MAIYLGNELIADNGLGILPTSEPDITPPANTVKIWYDNTLHIGDKVIEPNPITGVQDYSTLTVMIPAGDKTFIFPIQENTVYDMDIDWGEGDGYEHYEGNFAVSDYTGIPHSFDTAGIKYIKFKGSAIRSTTTNAWSVGILFSNGVIQGGFTVKENRDKIIGLDCLNGVVNQNMTVAGNNFIYGAFTNCINLVQAPVLPKNLVSVGDNFLYSTFNGCSSLAKALEIPQNITTIKTYFLANAFTNCTNLQKVPKLPPNITGTASNAFLNQTFYGCASLIDASDLGIPEGISSVTTQFLYACFQNCTKLKIPPNINLPLITSVGNQFMQQAFMGCVALKSMPELPQTITTVAANFLRQLVEGCASLTSDGLKPIPPVVGTTGTGLLYRTFYSCTGLTTLPDNYLPQGVTTVGQAPFVLTFYYCSGLTRLPKFPQNLTSIPLEFLIQCFDGCINATSCEGTADEQPWVKYSSWSTQNSCYKSCTKLATPTPYASIPNIWKGIT
jgi:hypothetical protein